MKKNLILILALIPALILAWCTTWTTSYECPEGSEYRENYYDNGKLDSQGCFVIDSDVMDWYWTYYYENGNKDMEWMMEDDLAQWEWKLYHENWKLQAIGNYKDDLEDWTWKYYGEDGTYLWEEVYENWELIESDFEDATAEE